MSAIRKFFEKKKADANFKRAGPGRKLSETQTGSPNQKTSAEKLAVRAKPTESSERAGAAALARLEERAQPDMTKRSEKIIRARAAKELEAEKLAAMEAAKESNPGPKEVYQESAPVLAVTGVYFNCPLIGPEALPKHEMNKKIREFLYQQLEEERGLTSCLILQSCNSNKEKVKLGVQTLSRYLENIIANPTEEKYHKIRLNNKVFQEKVACLEGAEDFLLAAGFELKMLQVNENEPAENYYVFPVGKLELIEHLHILLDALLSAEPIRPQLDRNVKVLYPSQAVPTINLPPDFFNITLEELKKEQQLRAELVERSTTFRTREMRERDEIREIRRYKYTLLRIRFPDFIMLQGTFSVHEPISNVYAFVREHLEDDWKPFTLTTATGNRISDNSSSLLDLNLVPAVILNFQLDPELEQDLNASGSKKTDKYLKDETLGLLEPL